MTLQSRGLVLCLDMFAGLVVALVGQGANLTARWLARLSRRLALKPVFDALILSLVALPVTSAMFSGPGVRTTLLGKLGPFVAPLVIWLVGFALFVQIDRHRSSLGNKRLVVGFCLAGALISGTLNHKVSIGGYDYLHAASVVVTIGLGTLACTLLVANQVSHKTALMLVLATLMSSGPAMLIFPAKNADRLFLAGGVGSVPHVYWTSHRIATWYRKTLSHTGDPSSSPRACPSKC